MTRMAVPTTSATQARQVEQRLRELDRKSTGAATAAESLIAVGRHHWHGEGQISAGGIPQTLTTWVTDVDDAIASFVGGNLVLLQPGRWSLWLQYTSDATEPGNSACWLEAAGPSLAPWGPYTVQLRDERLRGSGYANAGNLTQSVSWSGVVTAEQAFSPITPRVMWRANGTGVQSTGGWVLTAHYLGAARIPAPPEGDTA